mgnify:FL=1
MQEKAGYHTKQKDTVLEGLKQKKDTFCTIDEFMNYLSENKIQVGRTTVYRALERLYQQGKVLKVPSVEGAPAQYRYLEEEKTRNYGKLVCLKCGKTVPLQCGCIDHFIEHVGAEHGFKVDQKYTILYGYCEVCQKE